MLKFEVSILVRSERGEAFGVRRIPALLFPERGHPCPQQRPTDEPLRKLRNPCAWFLTLRLSAFLCASAFCLYCLGSSPFAFIRVHSRLQIRLFMFSKPKRRNPPHSKRWREVERP